MRSPLLPIGLNGLLPIGLMLGGVAGLFLCPPTIATFVSGYPAIASITAESPEMANSGEYIELVSLITEDPAIAALIPVLPGVQSEFYYPDLVVEALEIAIASTLADLPRLADTVPGIELAAIDQSSPAIASALSETQAEVEECEC